MMENMAKDFVDLLREALELPPEARAALAGSLLESLDAGSDPGAEGLWREEIARRMHEVDSGAAELVAWEDAKNRLRSRLEGR